MKPIDYYAPTTFASAKARNVEEAKADLAKAEAELAAETALNEFKEGINSTIRLANAIVQALSDTRDLTCGVCNNLIARREYAEFKNELCATLKEYGYKVVFIGDKSKAIVAKV